MRTNHKKPDRNWFEQFAANATRATGTPAAFTIALAVIVIWGLTGPLFNFSDTWQLVINTSTTIITFLMVFIIQLSQNKETVAIQLKLNELIAAGTTTSNRLVDIEDLTDAELIAIKKFYRELAALAAKENDIFVSHSLDEARNVHADKKQILKRQK